MLVGPGQLKLPFEHEVAVQSLISLLVDGLAKLELQFLQLVNQLEQSVFRDFRKVGR